MQWIYGRNPVFETLRAQRRDIYRLALAKETKEQGRIRDILRLANQAKVPIERLKRSRVDQIVPNNQGVALEVSDFPYCDLHDILLFAAQRKEAPFILILDTLQDPQNFGTLLRTADAVGVHGVILPLRQTVTVTPAVVNASSGASEYLLIMQNNLAQTIQALKKHDVWIVGLESHPESVDIATVALDGGLALVIGSEGSGIRSLVRNTCDILAHIPMVGKVESLNAAVAGSIALYLAYQSRVRARLN
jgi:23S rRNA (guanosine2251-2'-O)-methyltransferase